MQLFNDYVIAWGCSKEIKMYFPSTLGSYSCILSSLERSWKHSWFILYFFLNRSNNYYYFVLLLNYTCVINSCLKVAIISQSPYHVFLRPWNPNTKFSVYYCFDWSIYAKLGSYYRVFYTFHSKDAKGNNILKTMRGVAGR